MRFALLLVVLAIAATATNANTCTYNGYDFSSLTESDLTTSDSVYDYYLRPCGVVSQAQCVAAAPAASACQVQVNPAGDAWVTGLNGTISWGLMPNNQGAFYNQTGVQACWATGSPTDYYTNVEFVCNSVYSLSVVVNGCTQTYQVQTPLACGGGPAGACGFNGLDFSSYMGVDIQGSDGGSVYNYWLRVCGSVSSVPSCTQIQSNAAACQVQVNPAGATFDNGNWVGYGNTQWGFYDPANPTMGVAYTMMGAQSCWATGSPTNYYATVNFICSQSEQPLIVSTTQNSCNVNYTIATPKACIAPPPPPPSSKCGYNGLDFSSLMGTDIQGSDGGSVYQYYMSVCGALTSQQSCLQISTSASVCQEQVNPKGSSYDIGNWSPNTQWYTIENGKGVGYMLTGAQSCWATGSPTDYYAYVNFVCSETAGPLYVSTPQNSCAQNYTYPTPLACGSAPSTPCRASINGVTYDLSALTKSDLVWQYSPSELFALRVCGTVSTASCTASLPSSTAACLASSQGNFDMGDSFPVPGLPPLQYMDPSNPATGVTYQLTGANTCASEPGKDSQWIANVQLVCAQTQGTLSVSSVSSCEYNWSLNTPLGCPPGHVFETTKPAIATE